MVSALKAWRIEFILFPELRLDTTNASDTEAPFSDFYNAFQTDLFYPKFMIIAIFSILTKYLFSFLDGDFPVLPLAVFTFLNLLYVQECLAMRRTATHVKNF